MPVQPESFAAKAERDVTFNEKLSFGYGAEYKYDWGQFDNNGSYQASTKGHVDNLSIYGNLGWNIFDGSNMSFFIRNDNNKKTGNE